MKFRIYYIVLVLIIQTGLWAGNSKTAGFQFLNTIYSPKFKALGGPYPSVLGDINGLLVNPSGIAYVSNQEVVINYTNYLLDLKGGVLAYTYPIEGLGSISAGVMYFDYGEFEELDRFALSTGRSFVSRDFSFLASFAGHLNHVFSYGITTKYIQSRIDTYSSSAFALDIGFTYRMGYLDNLVVGLAARNLGESINAYDKIEEPLPRNLSFGMSKKIPSVPVIIHAAFNNLFLSTEEIQEFYYNFSIGLEVAVIDQLELRMGYNNDLNRSLSTISNSSLSGFSAGFGLYLGAHRVDYSYANYGILGATQYFGFVVDIDDLISQEAQSRSSIPPDRTMRLSPPSGIDVQIVSGRLVISWDTVSEADYNVYARIEGRSDWKKVNEQPVIETSLSWKKPSVKGVYKFKITSVRNHNESEFSEEISIRIE